MKKTFWIVLALIFSVNSAVFAKPERIHIRNENEMSQRGQGKALAKSVNLSKVEDPEVRKALQAVFKTLNLQAKQ